MTADFTLIGFAILGTIVGGLVGLVPGLHVYNVAGLALLLFSSGQLGISDEALTFLLIGMTVGWTTLNHLPAVFLFAPDDSSVVAVLPATKFLLQGRGREAVLLMGLGGLVATASLLLLAPLLDAWLRPIRAIIQPHTHWMIVSVIAFMLLGEWPRVGDREATPLRRLAAAWGYLGAGILTFSLSGLFGLVLMTRSPLAIENAFQNLLPAFVGLFTLPGLLQIGLMGYPPPPQTRHTFDAQPSEVLRGGLTGTLGGLFASVMPVVSGGIGGLLAGHATAIRGDRLFIISQGASKTTYFLGSLLLLFVPGVGLTRGGMAWMLTSTFVPFGWRLFALCVSAIGICAILAFGLLWVSSHKMSQLVAHIRPRAVAFSAGLIAIATTGVFTGVAGLAVMLVGTSIGLIPVFVGGRRMNCLGVLLLPISLNMLGVGATLARWLGL